MDKIDLHLHSTVSDGKFSPEELVRKAAALGLSTIALADHDSVDGIAPALAAAAEFPRLSVIPNVEISTDTTQGEVHVLGYFIDYTDGDLQANLERFRNSRLVRAQKMIAKLKDLGVHVEWPRVQEIAGSGTVGRPHIAQAMLEKGYITTLADAFTRYLAHDRPAYVPRDKLTPAEAVALIKRAGGLPALAHPLTVNNPEPIVVLLKDAGLVAIEGYYNGYTSQERRTVIALARRHGLIVTGGSDYHGLDESTETMIGEAGMPPESLEQLFTVARQRGIKLPAASARQYSA